MDEGINMSMPVAPAYGGNGFGNGFGGDGWWLILLLLCGWGGNGFGGGNQMYPWLNSQAQMSAGFQNQMLGTQVMGVSDKLASGFGDVQTALCGGFAGVNATVNGVGAAIAQQLANNQLGTLQRSFDAQTAVTTGMTGLQSQLAQCCCDNRMATVQTQNIVQTEGAATRLAIQQQTQLILDKMCQQEIDTLKERNVTLQNQVNMLNLAASQTAQTAALVADNALQTQTILNRLPATTTA